MILVHRVPTEAATIIAPAKCNGLQSNGHHDSAPAHEPEPVKSDESPTLLEPSNLNEAPEVKPQTSALESLAQNLEAIGKYRDMEHDVKVNDMIAFKVMTADFQISGYVIGLVEELNGDLSTRSYDLTLLIMGKFGNQIYFLIR